MVALGVNLLRSVDYGEHWDEHRLINSAIEAREKGKWTTDWYNYPSVSFVLARFGHDKSYFDPMIPDINSRSTFGKAAMRTRAFFIFFCLFLIPGIYLFGSALTNSTGGILAVLISSFGFELNYHMRWIAPDAVAVVFAVYAGWAVVVGFRKSTLLWWLLAAIFVALACGTKYPMGILFGVLCLAFLLNRNASGRLVHKLLSLAAIASVFVIVFGITTPGAFLDTGKFLEDIRFESEHYQTGHRCHSVSGFGDHSVKMVLYFILFAGSSYKWISCILFFLTLIGFYLAIRKNRKIAAVFLFPLIYLLFFAFQNVMIVRNYLVVFPFFAVAAAGGFLILSKPLENLFSRFFSFPKWMINGLLVFAIAAIVTLPGFIDLKKSSDGIAERRNAIRFDRELLEWMKENDKRNFLLSENLYGYLVYRFQNLPDHITARHGVFEGANSYLVFANNDPKGNFRNYYQANRHDYLVRTFGPRSVNYNYYPDWADRFILVMEPRQATGIPLD